MTGPSCPVPVRQLEMETAPAASASSLALVQSMSMTRPNPTDIRKAYDEHCPRKATRANVQRESHYPCDPGNDLLYGDDDGDSLASALSDIIAEEYGSGPFKVERATQPSAALSADAAAALESHRVKTSLGRDRPEDHWGLRTSLESKPRVLASVQPSGSEFIEIVILCFQTHSSSCKSSRSSSVKPVAVEAVESLLLRDVADATACCDHCLHEFIEFMSS